MVDTAQEGEERARETIETLNTEIQNLTKVLGQINSRVGPDIRPFKIYHRIPDIETIWIPDIRLISNADIRFYGWISGNSLDIRRLSDTRPETRYPAL